MTRTAIILAAVALLAAPALPAQQQQAAPCSTDAYRQFDFWIGHWKVATPDGQAAGENTIEPILNGCVLQESWSGGQGSVGRSFNMYDGRAGEWRQTWVDGNGGRLDLAGGLDDDGRMVLSGTRPGQDGGEVLHEISWTPREDGTVLQHWRASRDAGKTWQDLFVGVYSRRDG